jgi:hypothetical protein
LSPNSNLLLTSYVRLRLVIGGMRPAESHCR